MLPQYVNHNTYSGAINNNLGWAQKLRLTTLMQVLAAK